MEDSASEHDQSQVVRDAERIEEELGKLRADLWELAGREVNSWQVRAGRVRLAARLGSADIFVVYVVFLLAALSAGSLLTFFDSTKELGIALVVGAIFAGGSFVAQMWAVQQAKEKDVMALLRQGERQRIEALVRRHNQLEAELQSLGPTATPE